jgi:glyoxylase-like metal-dependent hydrolase (beta-lactamase superfamily II)
VSCAVGHRVKVPIGTFPWVPIEVVEVVPEVWRFRVPLDLPSPDHLYVHVIVGDDGQPIVVDTGLRGSEAALLEGLGSVVAARDFAVLTTHGHIDHWGLAAMLKPQVLAHAGCRPSLRFADADASLRSAGPPWSTQPWAAEIRSVFGGLAEMASGIPEIVALEDGRRLGGWEVLWTPGHCPGHICLWRESDGVLLCGDLLLPEHTPNVQASLDGRDALADFLASLEIVASLPVTLVLPAHGEPYRDAAARARALQAFHRDRLETLREACRRRERATVDELAEDLFSAAELSAEDEMLARLETLAHLEHLRNQGLAASDFGGRWRIVSGGDKPR